MPGRAEASAQARGHRLSRCAEEKGPSVLVDQHVPRHAFARDRVLVDQEGLRGVGHPLHEKERRETEATVRPAELRPSTQVKCEVKIPWSGLARESFHPFIFPPHLFI